MDAFPDSLLKHWPGVLFRQRSDLRFEFASPRLEELTGFSLDQWQHQPELFWKVIHESDVEPFRQHLARAAESQDGVTLEFRVRHALHGQVNYISEFRRVQRESEVGRGCYEGFWLDVTRQTLSERRLATASWKETLGLITLGLSHDFNNVLAGILGLSEQFLSQIESEHPFHEGLLLVKRNAQQAAHLIQRIALLHRAKGGTRDYHELNAVLRDNTELLRTVVPRRISIVAEPEPGELPLYVDAVALQQVLINLALNAADAMPERGQLTLRTSHHTILPPAEHYVGMMPRLPAACLEVIDTGSGIKPRLLPYIFDPFFTTKPMNRGSGLGLYNARLFAEKHYGALSVQSQEGKGSTFRVWLSIADFTEAQQALELAGRRRRSLLVVGCSGQQLDSTIEFLRQQNFHVVPGKSNAEDLLRGSDYVFDGLMLLVEPQDRQVQSLVRFVRQQKLPLKVILKTVGCNPDELDPQLSAWADLIISADLAEDTIPDRLAATFDLPRS